MVLVGGTGTGKTHLAAALGVAAIQQHGLRVRFYSTVDLVNMPEQENAAGRQGRLMLSLIHMYLVILDALSVFVVRAFVRLKQTLDSHQALARRIAQLEARTDARFKAVFDALRNLMTPAEPKRRPIGFVYPKEK